MGGLSDQDVEALGFVTTGSDEFIEAQCYTIIHKVVLGLSLRDLDNTILENPELLNTTDIMGRTPLGQYSHISFSVMQCEQCA